MRRILCATLAASLPLSGCDLRDRDLPAPYRRLEVPAQRLASPDFRNQGRLLYRRQCVLCHGDLGDGRGVRAAYLSPPPRDFTDATWQERNDDRHVYYAIAEGRRGTAMTPWKPTLSPGEIWSVVAYIRSRRPGAAGQAEAAPERARPDSAGGGPGR